MIHIQGQEKEEQTKPKVIIRKEIVKTGTEIKIKRKKQKRLIKLRAGSLKSDKPLAKLIKKKEKEKSQINKITNERGEVTTNTT